MFLDAGIHIPDGLPHIEVVVLQMKHVDRSLLAITIIIFNIADIIIMIGTEVSMV
jgi:lipoprotein signal peptidase